MDERPLAVMILGAESCGNRMALRAFVNSGFANVTETRHVYGVSFPVDGSDVVWLRSVPHASEWPDVFAMAELVRAAGYRPVALVPVRDWWCAAHSQVASGHVLSMDEALHHLRYSWTVSAQLDSAGVPWVPVSYEAAVRDQRGTLENALRLLDIDRAINPCEVMFDGNEKWL